jgi:uncharacterized protein YbjT (DUF2867 family)
MTSPHNVIVAGATGLSGRALVAALQQRSDIRQIIVLTRRSSAWAEEKVREVITDYTQPAALTTALSSYGPFRAVFCALGTTKKNTGSLAAQRAVDHDAVVQLGAVTRALDVPAFAFVSSIGAQSQSSNAYLKMKGETESALHEQKWPHLVLARPSFLLGHRDEFRLGEKIGILAFNLATPLLIGPLRKYRPIHVRQLAATMIDHALDHESGSIVLEGAQLGV